MPGRILTAGVDARELRLEVRFLQRAPDLLQEAATESELFEALARDSYSLVVLGSLQPEAKLAETIRRIREGTGSRRVSILAMVSEADAPDAEGIALGAGANAALRRPLDRFVLESWVSKLVDVPNRVRARIPVHVQVVGSRHRGESEHFYGLSRNLSVHGMLLASPVRIEARTSTSRSTCRSPTAACACSGASRARRPRWAGPTSATGSSSCSCPRPPSA
jgi:CheY-like chemotaxis protein